MTQPVPNPQQPLSPYLTVRDAAAAIAFYRQAFGAELLFQLREPSGKIAHAELAIAGAHIKIADEYPDAGALSPLTIGGTAVRLHLYVVDVDALVKRAVDAGATLVRPPRDEFFGDRVAALTDPFGHKWNFATRKEEVSPEEMQRRLTAAFG